MELTKEEIIYKNEEIVLNSTHMFRNYLQDLIAAAMDGRIKQYAYETVKGFLERHGEDTRIEMVNVKTGILRGVFGVGGKTALTLVFSAKKSQCNRASEPKLGNQILALLWPYASEDNKILARNMAKICPGFTLPDQVMLLKPKPRSKVTNLYASRSGAGYKKTQRKSRKLSLRRKHQLT